MWCVAYTQPLKENVAKQHLLDQGYEVYIPHFKKTCRHARRVEEKIMPLFPRYIFVGMDLSARWRPVNSTRGVSYLLMSGDSKPAKFPKHVIDYLRAQEVNGIVTLQSLDFIRGEKVRILEGAFKDQTAIFEANDRTRVQLLLTFMGRNMTVTLPGHAIKAA